MVNILRKIEKKIDKIDENMENVKNSKKNYINSIYKKKSNGHPRTAKHTFKQDSGHSRRHN